jgi:peptidoglycan hydrolase-like protein with peptidoglycan-binding domain
MRTLRLGAKGNDVKLWQAFLRTVDLYTGELSGDFGASTAAATRVFQQKHGLADDGVVGNKTLGVVKQLGLDLAPEEPALGGNPPDVTAPWQPPALPSDGQWLLTIDPRVLTNHQPGVLPCPKNPPPPLGWVYWQGSVPPHLAALAVKVETTPADYKMGSFVQAVIDGLPLAARVEWHDFQGKTGAHGCFRGTSLFRPKAP